MSNSSDVPAADVTETPAKDSEDPMTDAQAPAAGRGRSPLRALYDWTLALAGHRRAEWALGVISFLESSIFPIPPDVMLMPMVLAARERAWRLATICTIASVLGGLAGYGVGLFLFDLVGQPILDFYGYAEKFGHFQGLYNAYGAWIVFLAGFSPIPYKVFTIASGVTQLDILVFVIASTLSRGARFFMVAGLLWKFGTPIRAFIERWLGLLTFLFVVLLFGGFLVLKVLL